MQRVNFRAMGCWMMAALRGDPDAARSALANVPRWFSAWEHIFSRFLDDSELTLLNRQNGAWVPVSDAMWSALQTALAAAGESDGLVSPCMLRQIVAAGYDRPFDDLASGGIHTHPAPPVSDWRAIELDAAARAVRVPPGVELDLGGVVKGWAADAAAAALARTGPALVDAGGDIAVRGVSDPADAFPIGVADPADDDGSLDMVVGRGGGIATSGRDFRRWRSDGAELHHVLDPRTGRPAHTDILTATVIAPTAQQAEMAAKVALILGAAEGGGWIDARPELAAFFVLDGGILQHTHAWPAHRWPA